MATRVLVCSDFFYPSRGGGDLSMRLLCRELAAVGYDLSVCYFGRESDPEFRSHPFDFSTPVRGLWPRAWRIRGPWKRHLLRVISREKPEVVLAQQTVISPTVEVCADSGIPVITFLHNVDLFCLGSFWDGEPWKCRYHCIGCKDAGPRLSQFPFFRLELARSPRGLPRPPR